ncbi:MAG TPA: hypothetical protein VED20_02220 [Streptosporangiaceae bacterium]|nr:hypothetical protein [Streptosporangiaceae bacterium]
MFTRADVEKLATVHVVQPAVLSLYLTVPPDPAELSGLLVRAGELMAAAGTDSQRVRDEDENWVLRTLATRGRGWLGRSVAILACTDAGLLEVLPLPSLVPERAVLGTRPHIRPLLGALQRCPAHRVVDRILAMVPSGLAAVGLPACLAAVNADAVETLVVPDEGLVPGYECGRCGALSTRSDSCPDWGAAPLPVPDVIEEMVTRTLEDGGQISVIGGGPPQIAAKLRFPLVQ